MNTKKKILISIFATILVVVITFAISFFMAGNKQEEIIEIKNPYTISYFADAERVDGFTIHMPQDFSSKIVVNVDNPAENLQCYKFKHRESGEILFVVYISKGKAYEEITDEYQVIGSKNNYTYLWVQSLNDNEHIMDENKRNEFNEIAKYYNTIRSKIEIIPTE